jgi:transcriptional regulator of arginine metabolism
MDKLYRRSQILDLLKAEAVSDQAELRRRLAQRGIRVTQATVSRDIRELGVAKSREGYRWPKAAESGAPPQPTLPVILKEFLREVRQASNLVIVKTHPGNAHTVAMALDLADWRDIEGTVAGDDTIFVAAAGARNAARLRKKILAMLAS